MKISLRTLAVFALAVVLVGAYIVINRGRNLPDGKMTQTTALDIPFDNFSSEPVIPGRPRVEISTSKGSFTIELRPDLAPRSVIKFLNTWSSGLCDSAIFDRVEDRLIQGCHPAGNNPTEKSAQSFVRGSVGLTGNSQFFITKKDTPSLENDYTYIGRVVSGMNVVDTITKGDSIITSSILTK
jgi:peptidylprolyl isomerase